MRSTLLTAGIYILLFSVLIVVSCTNSSEIPFPADKEEFSQPVAAPLKFSAPEKLKFADSLTDIKLPSRPFDYDKLPTGLFDSSGFMPFPKPPLEISFDWDKLPAASFDYDKLPSKPLQFETQILPPPKTIKVGRPVRKKGASELLYEIGDPLNGKIISALFEDKNGFLWIAAENELYRYNGEELAYYMNFSFLISLLEDNTGRIWIASNTGSGIAVINTKTSTISFVRNEKKAFSRMFADRQNRIWLSTPTAPGPVTIIDLSTNTIKEIRPAQGLVTGNANSAGMFQDDFGNVWIATRNGGLNIIDFKNKKIKYLTKENGLSSDSLASALLITDDKKRVWAASYTGEIHSIDIRHGIIKRYGHDQGLKKDLVPSMLYGRDGNIWIGKQSSNDPKGGIEIIDPVNDKLKKIGPSNGLLSSNITRLAQSRNGSIWVGTSLGLNLLSLKNDYNIRRIGYKDVSTQMEDVQGKIWTGYLYDGIQIRDTNARTVKYLTTAQGLSDNTIQQIMADNGNVLVLNNIGVDIINFNQKKIEWLGNKQGIRNTPQIAVKTPDGKIWITMITPGIEVFDPAAKTIYHIDSISGIASAVVSNVLLDKAAAMWMGGTNSGIVTLDTKTLTTRALNVISLNESTGNKVFLADSRGNLWIGTGDRGVFMINADRDSITHFSLNEGVLSENVISLLEYNGKIFIGTNKGITILTFPSATTAKWTTESLGKSDGIEKEASTVYSDLITRKGEYWWGDKGIKIIGIADRPVQDSIAPPVFINGISLLNRQQYYITTSATGTNKRDTIWTPGKDHFYTDDSLPGNNFFNAQKKIKMDSVTGIYNLPVNLQIPHTDNYIQFHFLQMDPDRRNKDTIWYRYVLEGLDTKWSDRTANTNSENYVNLQSGQYTFKVSAAFKGKWSEPVIFSFTVLPPWWRTWWAYAAYLLCFSYSVWTFIKYRSRWLQKENRVLEEKVAHRTIQLNKSIDELKSTQAQLIQSEKMASLGELTAGIAHEIQNPLNFVNNFSEVNNELIEELKKLKSNPDSHREKSEEQDQILNDIFQNNEKINHHGKRADSIVKGMLQHSRSGSAQKELTDINALADEYLRLSYHGLRAKDSSFDVSLEMDFDKRVEKINVIPQDIGRVILNLINNAFYAVSEKKPNNGTPFMPTVSVKTKKVNNNVEITVKDNGNGIPQLIVDKIFQPFFTTKPTGQGTGLGLSLSYDIIKTHGGEIKVNSDEGKGTEFIILLPVT